MLEVRSACISFAGDTRTGIHTYRVSFFLTFSDRSSLQWVHLHRQGLFSLQMHQLKPDAGPVVTKPQPQSHLFTSYLA